ncbi:MAG: 7-cyano-7-deazaguanine synthase QueC [Candidatus Kapaibacteriota bacterium]
MKLAVVLMSGGLDSATTVAIAKSVGYDIAALHVTYGQRTQDRELKAFDDLCRFYNIENRLVVPIDYLKSIGGSSLTDSSIEIEKADLNRKEVPSTYVPFRNGNLLAIATSWAEVLGAKAIFIGAVQSDSSGYPDCRLDFFLAFEKAIRFGTKPQTNISIQTPLINLTKKDIVRLGHNFGVPFELTWSCYREADVACGVCDSCALRLRGFQQAGLPDPLPYAKIPNYV